MGGPTRGLPLLPYTPLSRPPARGGRVAPVRAQDGGGLAPRRWILPDDVRRPVQLPQAARLWRGLLDLGVLDAREEVRLERLRPGAPEAEVLEMPAAASAGAPLAGSGVASMVPQVVGVGEAGP